MFLLGCTALGSTPATAQTVTLFSLRPLDNGPSGITAGPDGNLWFTVLGSNQIGRITPAGRVTGFWTLSSTPYNITAGPDGNLWFTEDGATGYAIGRITPAGVITEFSLPSGTSP